MASRGPALNFIQVGANDGRYGDPLYKYVMMYPWRGILVEPQPDIYANLCANYASVRDRLIFENVAVAGSGAVIEMYKGASAGTNNAANADHAASVVSVKPSVVASQLGLKTRDLVRFVVPCFTLDSLIEKHSMSSVDVLQIDTEGHDFSVLKTINLSAISPSIIQFEHGHLAPREITDAVDYLSSSGYRVLYGGYQMDTIALHRSFLSSIA